MKPKNTEYKFLLLVSDLFLKENTGHDVIYRAFMKRNNMQFTGRQMGLQPCEASLTVGTVVLRAKF